MTSRHPVNRAHHDDAPMGARIADAVTGFMGSWRFLIIQTIVVAAWITLNTLEVTGRLRFDPFPYILLNLAFSTQAAYAAPLILLAGNRQAIKDRLTLEHAAAEAERAEQASSTILEEIRANTEATLEILTHVKGQAA